MRRLWYFSRISVPPTLQNIYMKTFHKTLTDHALLSYPHGPHRPSGPTHERYLKWKVGSELIASPCVLIASVRPPLRIMTTTRALVSAVSAFSGLIRSDGSFACPRGPRRDCSVRAGGGESLRGPASRPGATVQRTHACAHTHTRRPGVRVNEGELVNRMGRGYITTGRPTRREGGGQLVLNHRSFKVRMARLDSSRSSISARLGPREVGRTSNQ